MKKKGKLSDSEIKLLLIFFSLVFVAAAYFLVFQRYNEKSSVIEAANVQSAARVAQLEAMESRKAQVEEQTAECIQIVEDITAKYPVDVTTEKAIVFIQDMENATGMKVTDINFLMNNLVGVVSTNTQAATTSEPADAASATDDVDLSAADAASADTSTPAAASTEITNGAVPVGYYATISMNYQATYQSFKDMIDYVNSQRDRMTIPIITVSYDETTGGLTGILTVNMFYLTNAGHDYEPPTVQGINRGVTDVFRSSGVGVSSGSADVSEENGDEENEDGEGDEAEDSRE
ncbi:MAG: hypothetical protein HDQ95_15295 [Roseburia sp.]|nr:hypothetical protein [Roseburia sp.]